jgi:hypothetical protein
MKNILLLLLISSASSIAQIPTKLTQLQAKRDGAIDNINMVYRNELKKLVADPTVKTDPLLMEQILAELGEKVELVDDDSLEKEFLNKTWITDAQTEFRFGKNGAGQKKFAKTVSTFSWRIVDSLIEVSGRDTPDAPVRIWYIRFNKINGKASYGNLKDQLTLNMTRK